MSRDVVEGGEVSVFLNQMRQNGDESEVIYRSFDDVIAVDSNG